MTHRMETRESSGCALFLAALAIGIVTVAAVNGSFLAVLGGGKADLSEEWGIFAIQVGLVSLPFLLLALLGIGSRRAWVVGIVLTACFWGYFAYDVLAHRDESRGANIGLGILMMASPLVIAAACLIMARSEERRQSSDKAP